MAAQEGFKVNATIPLEPPSLTDLRDALQSGMSKDFAKLDVGIAKCPNLAEEPFGLAIKGIGGGAMAVDVGGIGNLHPYPKLEKYYNVLKIAEMCGRPKSCMIGPGAGPHRFAGCNCEVVVNVDATKSPPVAEDYVARLSSEAERGYVVLREKQGDCSLMVNLLLTDGLEGGHVLKVEASGRISDENFVSSMRKAVAARFGEKTVSIGGAFVIKKGTAKIHIMSDFFEGPLSAEEAGTSGWLKFFNMPAPLTCVSVFHSADPGLDLRMEHTHCFSKSGDGGHYHYDTSPDEVEYVGYFLPAETLVRIDRPST